MIGPRPLIHPSTSNYSEGRVACHEFAQNYEFYATATWNRNVENIYKGKVRD